MNNKEEALASSPSIFECKNSKKYIQYPILFYNNGGEELKELSRIRRIDNVNYEVIGGAK